MELKKISDMAKALFYQDLRPQDAFFDDEHFKFNCIATYNKLLNDEFKEAKLRNKMTEGFSFVEVSASWLKREVVPVKKDDKSDVYYAIPSCKVFTFGFDNMSNGVQFVKPVGGGSCAELIRISYKDTWQYCRAPLTNDAYFYQAIDRVEFIGRNCIPKDVEIWYIPKPDIDNDESEMADEQVMPIITTVVNIMIAARNGVLIDSTNNANSNTLPASEIDKETIIK